MRRPKSLHTKAVSAANVGVPVRGSTGVIVPGANPQILNAMATPSGLYQWFLSTPGATKLSVFEYEPRGVLTGQTAGSGSLPEGPCDDSPIAGLLKLCFQVFPFGRISEDSRTIVMDRANQILNRSQDFDYRLAGNPAAPVNAPLAVSFADAFASDQSKNALEMMNELERRISPLMWTANPTNNTGAGGYSEPYGLQYLVNPGWRDTYSQDVCPAADPLVVNFGANIAAGGPAAVAALVNLVRALRRRARAAKLDGVQWALVMPAAMFERFAEVWPCALGTSGCSVNGVIQIDGMAQYQMTQDILAGEYLPIDGKPIKVIPDDTMPLTYGDADTSVGDVFVLPIVVPQLTEGRGVWLEFFNMNQSTGSMLQGIRAEAAKLGTVAGQFEVMGGGRFLMWAKSAVNVCVGFGTSARWRIVLAAPFLTGRLTNVSYDFTVEQRTWNPAGNPTGYGFVNGGAYQRTAPTFYSPHA